MINGLIHIALVLSMLVALAACGREAPAYEEVAPASISSGDPIPAPAGEVILTIYGDFAAKNAGDALQLDMATLERLGLVKYTVHDTWLKTQVTYTGVLMSELSNLVGADDSASGVRVTALDDYQVDIPFTEINKWPILLATRMNGEYMSIEDSGPTRIIFPYHAYPEIDSIKYDDLWVWNIKSIEIN